MARQVNRSEYIEFAGHEYLYARLEKDTAKAVRFGKVLIIFAAHEAGLRRSAHAIDDWQQVVPELLDKPLAAFSTREQQHLQSDPLLCQEVTRKTLRNMARTASGSVPPIGPISMDQLIIGFASGKIMIDGQPVNNPAPV